mgnify:CR=1 FL=1
MCHGCRKVDVLQTYKKGGDAGGSLLENLYAMDASVNHDDSTVAVDGDAAIRRAELPESRASAANGANMGTVAVAQYLGLGLRSTGT